VRTQTDADAWWTAIDERIAQALAAEREAIFEDITPVIRGLRELCEALGNQLAELRWRQLGTQFDGPHVAFRELKKWANEAEPLGQTRAGDATASQSATAFNGDYAKPADGPT
jgi:hypothetical protein